MIVFDTSTLVGAAIRADGVPELALTRALRDDTLAVSEQVIAELLDVLGRKRLARFIDAELRTGVLARIQGFGVVFSPNVRVTDCRDAKDNKYLELAVAASAERIVSSDADLLVLHPWRGVRILRPAEYLAETGTGM